MKTTAEQATLDELDKTLLTAGDRLRSNVDAALSNHAVLGLIHQNYIRDNRKLREQSDRLMPMTAGATTSSPRKNIVGAGSSGLRRTQPIASQNRPT